MKLKTPTQFGRSPALALVALWAFSTACLSEGTTDMTAVAQEPDAGSEALQVLDESAVAIAPSPKSQIAFLEPNTDVRGLKYCYWGEKDCNRCVHNVEEQFDAISNDVASSGRIRFDGYAYMPTDPSSDSLLNRIDSIGGYEHVQGIGRIAGVGSGENMVFTHSTNSEQKRKYGSLAVVRMGAGQDALGFGFGSMADDDGPDQNSENRTVANTFTENNHPGGLSVMGTYAYVAQWCQEAYEAPFSDWELYGDNDWCNEANSNDYGMGISIYDLGGVGNNATINNSPPVDTSYLHVYGEPWIEDSSTTGIAAVKLASDNYLLALSRSGGERYGFYSSDNPEDGFSFVNSEIVENYTAENSTFVTECGTGNVYLFGFNVQGGENAHLYQLVTDASSNYALDHVKGRDFQCQHSEEIDGASTWCSMEAGVGTYITPSGGLIVYATEKEQSDDGNIRLVEFSGPPIVGDMTLAQITAVVL